MQVIILDTKALLSPQRIEQLLTSFASSQDVKQSSRQLYRRTLKQYFSWIVKKGYDFSKIARDKIIEYKEALLSKGMSSLTVGSYITSVRRFYEWTEANKYYPNIARGIKTPKRKQEFRKQPLTVIESKKLLNHCINLSSRDYAIVNLLIRTGLRTIEVQRAKIEDISFKGGKRILKVQGKGRDEKDDFVVLTDKAYLPISVYLQTRAKALSSEPLFISKSNNSKGGSLSTRTISKLSKEALKSIGLDGKEFTAHSLRHTTIVNCRRAGGTLEQAQTLARHSSPVTTQIYDKVFREEARLAAPPEELLDKMY